MFNTKKTLYWASLIPFISVYGFYIYKNNIIFLLQTINPLLRLIIGVILGTLLLITFI